MQATTTTHPPAGATALLPCVDLAVHGIGWYYLPVVLLSSLIVLVTALLFNNIQRQYPKFWISPTPNISSHPPSPQLPSPVTVSNEKFVPRLSRRSSSAPPTIPEPYEDNYDSTPPRSPSMDSANSTTVGSEKSNPQVILWVPGRVRWTRTEDKILHRLLKEGKSIDEIAEQFPGRTPAAIYQRSYMIPDLADTQYNNVTPIHI